MQQLKAWHTCLVFLYRKISMLYCEIKEKHVAKLYVYVTLFVKKRIYDLKENA